MSGPHGYFLLTGHGNSYAVGERPQCAMPEAWKPSYSEEQVAEIRAAVAELVEANIAEYAAHAAYEKAGSGNPRNLAWNALVQARRRRVAALAAFGGGQ